MNGPIYAPVWSLILGRFCFPDCSQFYDNRFAWNYFSSGSFFTDNWSKTSHCFRLLTTNLEWEIVMKKKTSGWGYPSLLPYLFFDVSLSHLLFRHENGKLCIPYILVYKSTTGSATPEFFFWEIWSFYIARA